MNYKNDDKDLLRKWILERNPELRNSVAPSAGAPAAPTEEDIPEQPVDFDPAPVAEEKSLAERYKAISNIDPELKTAREDADRSKMTTGIFQGISTAFGGKNGGDNAGFYDGLRKQADSKADALLKDRERKTDDLTTEHRLLQTEGGDRAAKSLDLWLQTKGLKPQELDGMSFDQKAKLFTDSGKGKGGANKQVRSVSNADGSVEYYWFDPENETAKPSGLSTGFAPKVMTNPYTDMPSIAANKVGAVGVPAFANPTGGGAGGAGTGPQPMPGESPAQFEARMKAHTAGLVDSSQLAVKEDAEVRDATSKVDSAKAFNGDLAELYKGALAEGGVGPARGRITSLKNKIGASAGVNSDKLNNLLSLDTAEYVRQISGTAASDAERANLIAIRPNINDDPALFKTKMETTVQILNRIKEREAGKRALAGGSAPQAAAPGSKKVVKKQHNKAANKTRVTYEDGTTEIVDGLQ